MLWFVLFDGEGGYIKTFLELPLFSVAARLTYCAYLIHPMVRIGWVPATPGASGRAE
jgi:hypothetical protein